MFFFIKFSVFVNATTKLLSICSVQFAMNNTQKVGIVVVVLAVLFGIVLLNLIGKTKQQAQGAECYQKRECGTFAATLNSTNIGVGLLFGLFFLGAYLLLFSRSEQELLKHLEREKKHLQHEEKLTIIRMLLDTQEQSVLDTIRQEEGITQQMLRYRTALSKAMVSNILSRFEKKDLIMRVPKGKTYAVYLKRAI